MRFSVILADPPWPYDDPGMIKGAGIESGNAGYRTMSVEDLLVISPLVKNVAGENSVLFLWTVGVRIADGVARDLMLAWGFDVRTVVFTWIKCYPQNGAPVQGPGRWSMSSCEYVMLGTRGTPHRIGRDVPSALESVVATPRGAHSEKPIEVHRRIERLMGCCGLEMFARRRRPGWTCIGDALTGRDISEDLAAVARDEILPEAGTSPDFAMLDGQGRLW